jgi:hypothetical protein
MPTGHWTLTFAYGCVTTGHHLHVAHLACPTGPTHACVHVVRLLARRLVHARLRATPVHVRIAPLPRVAVGTVARVVLDLVMTRGAIQAGVAVTFVDAVLTVGARVPATRNTRHSDPLQHEGRAPRPPHAPSATYPGWQMQV